MKISNQFLDDKNLISMKEEGKNISITNLSNKKNTLG